jgi:hypothetical protein
MMSTLAGMNVLEKLLALVSRYTLQSNTVRAMLVQVTILDAVSQSLVHYPFGLRFILGKLAADEECLEFKDLVHSLLPCQRQKDAVTRRRPIVWSPPAPVVVVGWAEGLIQAMTEKRMV